MNLSRTLVNLRMSKRINITDLASILNVGFDDIKNIEENKVLLFSKKRVLKILKKYSIFFEISYLHLKNLYHQSLSSNDLFLQDSVKSNFVFYRFLKFFAFCFVALILFFYIGLEIKNRYSKPELQIYSPFNNFVTNEKQILVSGKSIQNITLKINGESVLVSNDGSFGKNIVLNNGLNLIRVTASKNNGKENIILRRIIFEEGSKISSLNLSTENLIKN